mgnify:CR=1 FL=1
MAVKIKLQRIGKIRNAEYRVIIADARTRRSGKAIENIGIYQPKQEPSLIQIDSERVQYWLGVGAQPTEPVLALLKVTGDWQKFKGIEGAEGTLKSKSEKEAFVAPEKGSVILPEEPKQEEAPAESEQAAEAPAAEAPAEDAEKSE